MRGARLFHLGVDVAHHSVDFLADTGAHLGCVLGACTGHTRGALVGSFLHTAELLGDILVHLGYLFSEP